MLARSLCWLRRSHFLFRPIATSPPMGLRLGVDCPRIEGRPMGFEYRLAAALLFYGVGPRTVLKKAVEQTWWRRMFVGLRCDLTSLPPVSPAKFEIAMPPCDGPSFSGFLDELKRVRGLDSFDVL